MEFDRINRWFSLVANLGLLIGLLLVAYEIDQNSQLVRMQLVNEGNLGSNQIFMAQMGENPSGVWAKAIESPEDMTFEDYLTADALLFTVLNLFYRNYELALEGIYTEEDWKTPLDNYVGWYPGNAFGRAWWGEAKGFFPEAFAAYTDRVLVRSPRGTEDYWRAVQARLQQN